MASERASSSRHPRVCISYAHESIRHKNKVYKLDDLLRENGIRTVIDRQEVKQRIDWERWAQQGILNADFVLVIASPTYKAVMDGGELPGEPSGVHAEGSLLRNLYRQEPRKWQPRVLPVVLPGCKVADIPLFLNPQTDTRYEIRRLTQAGIAELLQTLLQGRARAASSGWPKYPPGVVAGRGRPEDHWLSSVRGAATRSSEVYFTGRSEILGKLAGFAHAARPGLCVVTGMPGAGKSAVLSVLLLRSKWPERLPEPLRRTVPDAGVAVAVHARNKPARAIVAEISKAVGAPPAPDAGAREALYEWLEARAHGPVVAIDALDEAKQPSDVAELAYELAGRVPLLVGVRPAGPRRADGSAPCPTRSGVQRSGARPRRGRRRHGPGHCGVRRAAAARGPSPVRRVRDAAGVAGGGADPPDRRGDRRTRRRGEPPGRAVRG